MLSARFRLACFLICDVKHYNILAYCISLLWQWILHLMEENKLQYRLKKHHYLDLLWDKPALVQYEMKHTKDVHPYILIRLLNTQINWLIIQGSKCHKQAHSILEETDYWLTKGKTDCSGDLFFNYYKFYIISRYSNIWTQCFVYSDINCFLRSDVLSYSSYHQLRILSDCTV
jgi:hypothetical protein